MDTLDGLTDRINAAALAVEAVYFERLDKLALRARSHQTVAMELEDIEGNLLPPGGIDQIGGRGRGAICCWLPPAGADPWQGPPSGGDGPPVRRNGPFPNHGWSVLSRLTLASSQAVSVDPATEIVILRLTQVNANHNGGGLAFGSDGDLYLSLGDGGVAGIGNGQNPGTLLGSIIRIDVANATAASPYRVPPDNPFVDTPGVRSEIWAYGFRNPWRLSFDAETGELWVGDVGAVTQEEVDRILPGRNYGWEQMEGTVCLRSRGCDIDAFEPPVVSYGRDEGAAVIGGYVYRGARIRSLVGAYVYGDFGSNSIWALRFKGGGVTEHLLVAEASVGGRISSFGNGPNGELFVVMLGPDGGIYRLAESAP